MASQLVWHVENQVLHLKLSGNITAETLLKNSNFVASLLGRVESDRVHVIMDMMHVTQLPRDTGNLRNVLAPMVTHEKMGWTVVMTQQLVQQAILNRTVHRLTEKWGYVGTFREAAELIRRADSKLWMMSSSEQREARLLYILK